MASTTSCQVSSPAMARLSSMIAVLKPFSSKYALSALRSASASSPVSVRILRKSSSSRKIRFSVEGDSHVCICTKTWTNFVRCLSAVHIIGRRVSGNQDQNLVAQDRSLRLRTIAERSHELGWRTLIDNPARIEVPESTGPRTPKRENHMVVHSNSAPSCAWADVLQAHRRKMEQVLAGGYGRLRVENLLRWSYY